MSLKLDYNRVPDQPQANCVRSTSYKAHSPITKA